MVWTVAHHKHQNDGANHADGFTTATRLLCQFIGLGQDAELGAQCRIAYQDGYDRKAEADQHGTDEHDRQVVDFLKVGILHTCYVTTLLDVRHGH